jgi:hypothetical protein
MCHIGTVQYVLVIEPIEDPVPRPDPVQPDRAPEIVPEHDPTPPVRDPVPA